MRHTNNFDCVRIVAAVGVLVSHQFALAGFAQPEALPGVALGSAAVYVFFAVSGFLVAQSWTADPHIGRFAARRMLRIWPALAVVGLLSVVALGPLATTLSVGDYFRSGETARYLQTLAFRIRYYLPGVFDKTPYPRAVNGSLWSLEFEVVCYAGLAVFGIMGALKRPNVAATICIAIILYSLFVTHHDINPAFATLREMGVFFVAGVFWTTVRERMRRRAAGVCVAFLTLAAALSGRQDAALIAALPYATILFGCASTPALQRFGRFGDLSYGIYIYAFPVQQTLIWATDAQWSVAQYLPLSLAATGALAFASWHLVERPALLLKPHAERRPVTAIGNQVPLG